MDLKASQSACRFTTGDCEKTGTREATRLRMRRSRSGRSGRTDDRRMREAAASSLVVCASSQRRRDEFGETAAHPFVDRLIGDIELVGEFDEVSLTGNREVARFERQ